MILPEQSTPRFDPGLAADFDFVTVLQSFLVDLSIHLAK
jgi:hypothetical protein